MALTRFLNKHKAEAVQIKNLVSIVCELHEDFCTNGWTSSYLLLLENVGNVHVHSPAR